MGRAEKEQKVKEIAERLQAAEAAVLADYRGLTVPEAAELRASLDEVQTKFAIVKNSLTKLAVKEAGLPELEAFVDGPTAIAFIGADPVAGAKKLVDAGKQYPVLQVRGGFAEGRVLTGEDIKALAALESREAMLATLAGLAQAQLARTAWMMQALQMRFLAVMEAYKEKVPDGEPAGEAPRGEDTPDPGAPPGGEPAEGDGPGEPEPDAPAPAPEETETEPSSEGGQEEGGS
jgi:large subunit ribosomal protein L10